MTLILRGHAFRFETENICRLFLPHEKIAVFSELPSEEIQGVLAITELVQGETETIIRCSVELDGERQELTDHIGNDHPAYRDECELRIATLLYDLFSDLLGFTLSWGIVTGVRPVKLLRHLVREQGEEKALTYFRERLLVSETKLKLCQETLRNENKILELSRPDSFSLYISIPFCPTRCDYCSFVSQTVERAAKLIPAYVDNLCREIEETGKIAATLGLRLETVYFGGGTPTTLSASEMAQVLRTVESSFDLSHLREYTVEAGRPDTVTKEKLQTIRAAGVSRVSINPQTLEPEILRSIGRKHTVEQFYDAFDMARQCGFDHINTDLIAGLPGDTPQGFASTLSGIFSLSPESITVHTLSMKRASNLVIRKRTPDIAREDAVSMVAMSAERLTEKGYAPYYLYRQSRTVGGQENVGWSKPGMEGLYNVYIMDETHTILACGAGAVTKMKQPHGTYLERIFNFKFPYEYNTGLSEMLNRKRQVLQFYEKNIAQTDTHASRD